MPRVTLDTSGVLVVDGQKLFPISFSEPPPIGGKMPNGTLGADELRNAGGNFIRTGPADFGTPEAANEWNLDELDAQIKKVKARMDDAAAHGLRCWLYLGKTPDLPATPGSANEQLIEKIVGAFKAHPALGAYKGYDEPAWGKIDPAGLVRAYQKIKALDPDHPIVIIQAPRGTAASLTPYRPAFDVTGVDIFPVAYPPAKHSDSSKRDISVVGDMTSKMVQAAGGKPVWTTLQIAWAGTVVSKKNPGHIPCFPSLHDERFMAYQAIVSGARGLSFFGGHLTQICSPEDAKLGWNWSFWRRALRPVVTELGSADLKPALVAPNAQDAITAKPNDPKVASDIQLVGRRAGRFLYVIALKASASGTALIDFTGLPQSVKTGRVLFEYVQEPPPRPYLPDKQMPRPVNVTNGRFQDWFRPHDVHVYRFPL